MIDGDIQTVFFVRGPSKNEVDSFKKLSHSEFCSILLIVCSISEITPRTRACRNVYLKRVLLILTWIISGSQRRRKVTKQVQEILNKLIKIRRTDKSNTCLNLLHELIRCELSGCNQTDWVSSNEERETSHPERSRLLFSRPDFNLEVKPLSVSVLFLAAFSRRHYFLLLLGCGGPMKTRSRSAGLMKMWRCFYTPCCNPTSSPGAESN